MIIRLTQGTIVSQGLTNGQVLFLSPSTTEKVTKINIKSNQIKEEINKFYSLLENAINKIEKIKQSQPNHQVTLILSAYKTILEDKFLKKDTIDYISSHQCNVEYAIDRIFQKHIDNINQTKNESIQIRAIDLHDIRCHLLSIRRNTIAKSSENIILVTKDISFYELLQLSKYNIKAILIEEGSSLSHLSILSKGLGIPLVIQLKNITKTLSNSDYIFLNTYKKKIIISPTDEEKIKIKKQTKLFSSTQKKLTSNNLPFVLNTEDKRKVEILFNIDIDYPFFLDKISQYQANVGLYRTEHLFLSHGETVSSKKQIEIYKRVLESSHGNFFVFRTIDIGIDKVELNLKKKEKDTNTFLYLNNDSDSMGVRGIRYSLKNPLFFRKQLNAIFKAAFIHNQYNQERKISLKKIGIMFPVVSTKQEIIEALKHIEIVKEKLLKENIKIERNIYEIGIMIEVPSILFDLKSVSEVVDFMSIGSNDMIQYIMATNRNCEELRRLTQPLQISILKLLSQIVKEGKNISICGDLGANPYYFPILLGLGIQKYSMNISDAVLLRNMAKRINYALCLQLVDKILNSPTLEKRKKHLITFHKTYFNDYIKKNMITLT